MACSPGKDCCNECRSKKVFARPLTLGDATGDVAAFQSTVSAGDQYLGARQYDDAIAAYQAGAAALLSQASADGLDVQTLTTLNTQIQAIESKHAGGGGPADTQAAGDAGRASDLAHQMLTTATTPGGYAPPVFIPPAPSTAANWQLPAGVALGVVAAALGVYAWMKIKPIRQAKTSMREARRLVARRR